MNSTSRHLGIGANQTLNFLFQVEDIWETLNTPQSGRVRNGIKIAKLQVTGPFF